MWIAVAVIPLLLGGFFVWYQPGALEKDAWEYFSLAQSIHQGQFALHGQPSMLREPGYPTFLALLGVVSFSSAWILSVQVLLLALNALIIGDTIRRLDPRVGWWPGLAAGCAYGLAAMAAQTMLEVFTAFLLALATWCLSRFLLEQRWRWLVGMGFWLAALILTRSTLLLVAPLFIGAASYATYQKEYSGRRAMMVVLVSAGMVVGLIAPWLVRNQLIFHRLSLTTRAGGQLYVRAWKAAQPWSSLGDTLVSVVIGRGLQSAWLPGQTPITNQQWLHFNGLNDAYLAQGLSMEEIQPIWADRAKRLIVSSPGIFLRAGLWSGVDLLRLFALPSPRSPTFPIEFTFANRAGTVASPSDILQIGLTVAHLVQLVWWFLIGWALYTGFREMKGYFLPGLVMLAVLVAHAPADNIVRYALPIHPWIVAGIVWTGLVSPRFKRWAKQRRTAPLHVDRAG